MVRLGLAFLLLMSSMAAAMAQAAPQAAAAHKPATKAARAKQPTPPAPGGNGRCIGVLSQLGETFAVEKIGIMVFQNAFDDVPIDTWRIDDLVAARISSFIGPRATVRRLSLPRGAIAAIEKERRLFGHEDDITNAVRQAAAGTHCSRYVVVTRGVSQYSSTNQSVSGLGFVSSAIGSTALVHALAMVRVYDGETFKVLRRDSPSIGQRTFMSVVRGPHREVDKSILPEPSGAPQNGPLRDMTRQLVAQSLDMTLPTLQILENDERAPPAVTQSRQILQRTD